MEAVSEFLTALDDDEALQVICKFLTSREHLARGVVLHAVPHLTYAPTQAITEKRKVGTIRNINAVKGFGFIDCPEIKELAGVDVFLSDRQAFGYKVGDQVSFAILLNKDGKPQAFDLGPPNGGPGLWKPQQASWQQAAPWGQQQQQAPWPQNMMGGMGSNPSSGGKGMPALANSAFNPNMNSDARSGFHTGHHDILNERHSGVILNYNHSQGFGFIRCHRVHAIYGKDVFLHAMQKGQHEAGDSVSFSIFLNKDGKPQAKDVTAEGMMPSPPIMGQVVPPAVTRKPQMTSMGLCMGGVPVGPSAPRTAMDVPGVTDARHYGTILVFREEQGFGFIQCQPLHDKFGKDVFLHREQLAEFQVGQDIEFGVFLNKNGHPQAKDLALPGSVINSYPSDDASLGQKRPNPGMGTWPDPNMMFPGMKRPKMDMSSQMGW